MSQSGHYNFRTNGGRDVINKALLKNSSADNSSIDDRYHCPSPCDRLQLNGDVIIVA